ncbi:recombination protein NinB [Pseudomonas aeruginosa]
MADRTFRIQGAAGIRPAFVAAWNLIQALMRDAQGGYELVLRPLKSKRSIEQNKRYHALLRDLSAVAWLDGRQYGPEAWAEYFKQTFIGWDDLPGGGKRGISTTTLSVAEFSQYMLQIEVWCSENGFPVQMEEAA